MNQPDTHPDEVKVLIRYRCPICQQRIATYVPRGSDGSAVFFKRHKDRRDDDFCTGWGLEATKDDEEVIPL